MSVPSSTRPLQNCRKLYFVSLHCKASPIQGLCLAVGFSCVVSFSRARLLTRTVLDQGILSLVLHLLGSVSMSTSTFMQTLCLKFSKGIETPSSDTFEQSSDLMIKTLTIQANIFFFQKELCILKTIILHVRKLRTPTTTEQQHQSQGPPCCARGYPQNDASKFEALCHSMCGTIKYPTYPLSCLKSKVLSDVST